MKTNFLFPHRFKRIGWILLIPSIILGSYTVITDYEPSFLDTRVFSVYSDTIFAENVFFGLVENNILNEILGILLIASSLMVAFSREKDEDEFISKIRLESLVWATYANYAILLLFILFLYGPSFILTTLFNLFTILIFFIVRFNWRLWKFRKTA